METSSPQPELAFYYPNPFWMDGDWIKNLILFFDGIALLVPTYMKDRLEESDPAIVAGLRGHGLLHIIEPENAVNKAASETLASVITDIIASGVLGQLKSDSSPFHELSMSRLGYNGDEDLAAMIFEELKQRGLARDTEDGVSIPMHPMIRSFVLTLLSQLLRAHGTQLNVEPCPATDRAKLVEALRELLNLPSSPATGRVVAFDLSTVGVNMAAIPIDEILSFHTENQKLYQNYRRSVRLLAFELSRMTPEEERIAFDARQAELDEIAADIRRTARKAWRKPCAFALSLTGAACAFAHGSPLGAALAAGAAVVGFEPSNGSEIGAYSYLFRAHDRYA